MADVSITTSILGLDQIQSGLNKTSDSFKKMGSDIESAGSRLTVGVTAPLLAAGAAALKFALDAEESENLFTVSMGAMEESARKWSKDLNENLGLNDVELRRTVGTLNVMAKSMGISEKASFEMSKGVAELSHDMASFFNLDPAQAFEKIRAGITGEAEPLKQLGILVNETTVKMAAMNHGIIQQGEELSEQQKVLARYITILESTGAAQGDLARTIESPTNQLRIMGDRAEVLARTVGEVLRPYLIELLDVGRDVLTWAEDGVKWFKTLDDTTKNVIVGIAGFAVALGPLLVGVGAVIKVIGVFVGVVAAIASPIGLAVAAIGVLAAAGVALANNWDTVVEFTSKAWSNIKIFIAEKVSQILETFGTLTSWIPGFETAIEGVRKKLAGIIDAEKIKRDATTTRKQAEDITKSFDELAKTATKDSKDVEKSTKALIASFTKEAIKAGETDEKALSKKREMTRKRIDLAVEEGRITTDEKIKALNEQLQAVQKNSEEEIKIREDLLKTYENIAADEIDIIKNNNNLARSEQMSMLQDYEAYYRSIGESGEAAANKIQKAMSEMQSKVLTDSEKFNDELKIEFRGVGDDWADVAKGMHNAFGKSIGDMLANGEGLKAGMTRLFDSIKNIVAQKIGEIIASRAWQALIAGPAAGGIGGIGAAAAGGAAGAAGAGTITATAAGAGAGVAAGLTMAAGVTAGTYVAGQLLGQILDPGKSDRGEAVKIVWQSVQTFAKLREEYLQVLNKLSKTEIDDFNDAVDEHYKLVERHKSALNSGPGAGKDRNIRPYDWFKRGGTGLKGVPNPEKLPYGEFAKQQEFLQTAPSSEVFAFEARTEELAGEYNFLREQWKTLSVGGTTDITPMELEQRRTALYSQKLPAHYSLPDLSVPSFSQFAGGSQMNTSNVQGFARGGSIMVNKPTMIMAGENGPEKLTISPNGSRHGGSGGSMIFNGPVIMDEITARMFARGQADAIAMENNRYAY